MWANADLVNGLFELGGAAATAMNCVRVIRDEGYAGISAYSLAFFTLWGLWNLFYYPSLGQIWSLAGGTALVTANFVWISLMAAYGRKD